MSPPELAVNSKVVLCGEPYQPLRSLDDELIGRTQECRTVLAAWMAQTNLPPLAPLLVGDPGVGKNRLVYELARCTRKDLYVVQGHEDVTAEDLICAVRFSDEPDKKMDYILSPLSTAMLRGAICFVDEIGKLRPRALAPLASVLDERRYLDSALLGERIHAHPGFRFIAATNSVDIVGDNLPDFIHSRLRPVIEMDYLSRGELERIVKTRFERVSRDGEELLASFWSLWFDHKKASPPSPRDLIYLFGLTLNLADMETAEGAEASLNHDGTFVKPQARHLEEAFEQLFLSKKQDDDNETLAA